MTDIKSLIEARAAADPRLKAVLKKIKEGTATFKDTAYYAEVYSSITGKVFSANVLDLVETEREDVCKELLRGNYEEINNICAQVQTALDEAAGIHIKPQRAAFPTDRVGQIAHSLLDPTVKDSVIKRRANTGVANVSKGFHDSYIKINAKFRNDAGLKVYINRETDGKCCEWCTAMAGRYSYGTEPDDVYRRHDNCGCTVTYENGKQRQDVWSKRSWTAPEVGAGAPPPTRFTPDNTPSGAGEPVRLTRQQAAEIQAKNQPSILTNGKNSGKMESRELESIIRAKDGTEVSKDVKASIENTISVIPEQLRKRLEEYVPEIIIEEGRGYSSFLPKNKSIILDKETATQSILHELGHAWAKMDNLYEDEEFLAVLADGLEYENWDSIIPYNHPYKNETVFILTAGKFVDPYQGRVYADIFSIDYSDPIDLRSFQEYISVGFKTYFSNPELLKEKDAKLFYFLEDRMK